MGFVNDGYWVAKIGYDNWIFLFAGTPVANYLDGTYSDAIRRSDIMAQVKLIDIAHGRSGDKGNKSNVGIIARHPDVYPFLKEMLTAGVVKEHMKHICKGKVERYEMPNIDAFNFVLNESLGGGGTVSLKLDAQGKTHAATLLRMDVEVPDGLLQKVK